MKNKLIIIVIIICAIIIGTLLGISLYHINANKKEEIVYIKDANFTLNDIKVAFLNSPYAKENKCKAKIKNSNMEIKCMNKEYIFNLIESDLLFETTESENKEIFKYVVDSLETIFGSSYKEYYLTMDKFLNKELSITNLYYDIDGSKHILKVNLLNKLDKYKEKEIIDKETIVDINTTNYIFSNEKNKIDNIEFIYEEELNWIVFAGVLYGENKPEITLKLYNENEQLLYTSKKKLDNANTGTSVNTSFVINLDLEKTNLNISDIKKYSISLND